MSVQYWLLKVLGKLICCLPYSIVLLFGSVVGWIYYHVSAKARNRAIDNLKQRLGLSAEETKKIAKACFYNVGRSFVEILYMPRLSEDSIDEYVDIEGQEHLIGALAEGNGVVLVTAHLGNWEWMAARLSLSDFPLTAIVQRQPDDVHTELLNEYRQWVGIEVILRKSEQIVRTVKALKRGRILGFLIDAPVGKEGLQMDFLGAKALIALGPAFFAAKMRTPIVPAFIKREGGKHKVVIMPEISIYSDEGNLKEREIIMREILDVVENKIRETPSEWLWMMKRWIEIDV